ncbi:MAG: sugar ABC transporter permease [Oscillospiraceae bacterium]|nr:sugar ABC transporter permease [Oscillospiraceae bacterium]
MNLSYEKKKGLYGYGFIGIWFIGALMFFIIPVIQSFIYAFYDVTPDVGALVMKPLGIDNFKRAFTIDPDFRVNLTSVLGDTAWQTPIVLIFSLFVAIIINQEFKGRTFARAVFFLPVIIATGPVYAIITGNLNTSGTAEAEQFSSMFSANMVDELLEFVGIYGFNDKLTEILSTMTSDILNLVWKCGIQIIVFLSALQGIPSSAKEAAGIEGATAWEFFWKITLPYVSPMILVNLVYTIIDTFVATDNKVMTQVLRIQDDWKYGLSAAMAWSYFIIVLIVVGIIFAIMNKIVYYDD